MDQQGMLKPKSFGLGEVGDKLAGDGTGQGDWGKFVKNKKIIKT